ncbi:MAG: VOC family protein [Geodermatophilaceae bacterium]|nr:VOC family protein [Geodermatophilaceae bacterium]
MGSTAFTVTFDCADPHRQASFWAAALDWQVEDHRDLIAGLQQAGYVGADDMIDVAGVASWKAAAAVRDPGDPVDDRSGMGRGGRLLFQIVPEPKSGKNRVHLDVRVGADASAAKIEQLTGLGATVIGKGEQGGHGWVVLSDPEGNEFCVA